MQWLSVASLLALTARRLQGRAGGSTMRCSGGCEQSSWQTSWYACGPAMWRGPPGLLRRTWWPSCSQGSRLFGETPCWMAWSACATLAPELDDLGRPLDVSRCWRKWPAQWLALVTRFSEKLVEGCHGSAEAQLGEVSDGEFLYPEVWKGGPFLAELASPSREGAKGTEASSPVCARRRMPLLNFHSRASAMAQRGAGGPTEKPCMLGVWSSSGRSSNRRIARRSSIAGGRVWTAPSGIQDLGRHRLRQWMLVRLGCAALRVSRGTLNQLHLGDEVCLSVMAATSLDERGLSLLHVFALCIGGDSLWSFGRASQHKRYSASRCCEDSPHDDPSCLCGSFEDQVAFGFCLR